MLETIREYAREQLDASGEEAELRRRQALATPSISPSDTVASRGGGRRPGGAGLDALAAEHDNARAALEWARDEGEDEVLLRLDGRS